MKKLQAARLGLYLIPMVFIQTTSIFAQKLDSSSMLAVVPFKEAFEKRDDDIDYSKVLAERVLTAVEQSKRFDLLDRTDFEVIRKEIELQEGKYKEEFEDWDTQDLAKYGKRLRADFILTGTISNVGATLNAITGTYKATIGFLIKVVKVSTGKIYVTESFEVNSGSVVRTKPFSDSKEAISAALVNVNEPVKLFVDKFFPIYAKYLRTEEVARNEMREAMINGGTDKGFRSGQKLDIVILDNSIAESLPPIDIGDAEIISIQPEYAKVKIKSTKRNIESIQDKSKVLYFRSKAD